MKTFIPGRHNKALLKLIDTLFPVLLKGQQNINEIKISEEDKQKLRDLREKRVLFFCNHPSTAEPPVTFFLSKIMGDRFFYMASRQVFEWGGGMVGKVIANAGGYSVIAGIADRDSLKMSREILARPAGKLAIFPEGEPTSGENENLMPLQKGSAQLGFWGLSDIRRKEPEGEIFVLPAFIKYTINSNRQTIEKNLDKSLGKLEKKLKIEPGNRNFLRRFLSIGRVLLEDAEKEYGIEPAAEHDYDYRIGRVRHALLDSIAEKFGIRNYPRGADAIMKLRHLFSVWELLYLNYPDPKLPKLSKKELGWMKRECVKAFDFIVIKRGYLMERPTAERMYEWLARLESYVFGKTPRALGGEPSPLPRTAHVFIGDAYPVSHYWEQYQTNKRQAVQALSDRAYTELQRMLDASLELNQPINNPISEADLA